MIDLLSHRRGRRLLFFCLYLSEGAPIGYLWWYLPTKLRASGTPLEEITALTALLVVPWTFKFLWAPLVDTMRGSRWAFREWILAAQLMMGLALLPLFWLDGANGFSLIRICLLLHAFAAATQDVAIDALAIETSTPGERGSLNGWMQAGMLLGRSLFGGVALYLDARLGQPVVLGSLLGVVWLSMGLLAVTRAASGKPRDSRSEYFRTLLAVGRSPTTWAALFFALVAGAGFEGVGAVAGPFLIDRGLTAAQVGAYLSLPSVAAMLVGALIGGRVADRIGHRAASAVGVVLLALLIAALTAVVQAESSLLWVVLTSIYLGIGFLTAASYALFMDLTEPALGATQFSAYMGATNGCEAWATFAVGRIAGGPAGYGTAFLALAGVSLLSLLAWPALRSQRPAA